VGFPAPTEEIIGGTHVESRQDGRHDPDHALAAFVHDNAFYQLRCIFALTGVLRLT
jgi:hypothetical protein